MTRFLSSTKLHPRMSGGEVAIVWNKTPRTYYQNDFNTTQCVADQPPASSNTAWLGAP
jgi:hypothetical protein